MSSSTLRALAAATLSLSCLLARSRALEAAPFPEPAAPAIPAAVFKVAVPDSDFEFALDGRTPATIAIQRAIDACRAAGGGHVIVPAGTYLIGPIELASHTDLHLDKGAVLLGVSDFKAYEWPAAKKRDLGPDNVFNEALPLLQPLIYAQGLTDVLISGPGTIDGAGKRWWDRALAEQKAGARNPAAKAKPGDKNPSPRPRQVLIANCTRVRVEDVMCKDSPNFNFLAYCCTDVVFDGVRILAPWDSPNTDGIDPYSCRNVVIRRCSIAVGDDNISFKSGVGDGPLENVYVVDCAFGHGHGASIGSNLGAGMRAITVSRCTFDGTDTAIRIKSARDRGALVENVRYDHIAMTGVGYPVYLDMFYFDKKGFRENAPHPRTLTTPVIRNVTISNVRSQGSQHSIYAVGLPESPLENVVLQNVDIEGASSPEPTMRSAGGLVLKDVVVNGQALTVGQPAARAHPPCSLVKKLARQGG